MEGGRSQQFFASSRYFLSRIEQGKEQDKDYPRDKIVSDAIPYGVDWFKMRIVLSSDICDGMVQVRSYSLAELVEAHASLDALDKMRQLDAERQKRKSETNRRRRK